MHANSSWRVLVGLGVLLFALGPAMQYGAIWDHRARPTPDVTVVLRDGSTFRGELTREWSKDWVLVLSEGAMIQFPDNGYQRMEFKAPLHAQQDAMTMLWEGWRGFVPLLLVCIALFAYAAHLMWSLREQAS